MSRNGHSVLFSIVTVCKNAGAVLDSTLDSVRKQTFRDFQLIVVDGKSTDNTTAIVEKYSQLIDVFVSEEDDGIYYAMNKGVNYAVGEYIYFLNAGDVFRDDCVLETAARYLNESNCGILYGDTLVVDPESGTEELQKPSIVDKLSLWSRTINHQGFFARRILFDQVGEFDTSFKIKADHDWILRCYNHACGFRYVPLTIAQYDNGGFSAKNWRKFIKEDRKRLQSKNYSRLGRIIIRFLRSAGYSPRKGGYVRKVLNDLV